MHTNLFTLLHSPIGIVWMDSERVEDTRNGFWRWCPTDNHDFDMVLSLEGLLLNEAKSVPSCHSWCGIICITAEHTDSVAMVHSHDDSDDKGRYRSKCCKVTHRDGATIECIECLCAIQNASTSDTEACIKNLFPVVPWYCTADYGH